MSTYNTSRRSDASRPRTGVTFGKLPNPMGTSLLGRYLGDPKDRGYHPRPVSGQEGQKREVPVPTSTPSEQEQPSEPEVDDCILTGHNVPQDYIARSSQKIPMIMSVEKTVFLFRREAELWMPKLEGRPSQIRLDGGWKYQASFPDSLSFQKDVEVEMAKINVGVVWHSPILVTLVPIQK